MKTWTEAGKMKIKTRKKGKTSNNIWKNGTFIMSLLSRQIFFH